MRQVRRAKRKPFVVRHGLRLFGSGSEKRVRRRQGELGCISTGERRTEGFKGCVGIVKPRGNKLELNGRGVGIGNKQKKAQGK
jgi:hypothetical protein